MSTDRNSLLANKYRIESEVGRGAFGRVYCARDIALDRTVAIKELDKVESDMGSTVFADHVRRFEREARVQARFNHPNIVHVYELVRASAQLLYLVMEYVDGGSLKQYLERKAPLPLDEVVRLTQEILVGLSVVHADPRDIVHRDIKPSNILLTKDGHAKLTDFGLAQVGDESMRSQGGQPHPGTVLYMSSEQETTSAYLYPTSDLFSVGCVMFEMLTGVAYKPARRRKQTLRDLRADAPAWLEEIVARALEKDADARVQSAEEMGELLKAESRRQKAEEERKRKEAEEQARQEARWREWFTEAGRLMQSDPKRALELIEQIANEESNYPGLEQLRQRVQQEIARQARLREWFAEAEQLARSNPKRALELVEQIADEEPNYPGLEQLRQRAQQEMARQEQLQEWFAEAEQLAQSNPKRALELIEQVANEEPDYPGLEQLRQRVQREIARQEELREWFSEAEQIAQSNPTHALVQIEQIVGEAPNYPGLEMLRQRIQQEIARQERLRGWFTEAERIAQANPTRALELVEQIASEGPNYPELEQLRQRAQQEIARQERLRGWFTEAEQLTQSNPKRALELIEQIAKEEPNYPALSPLRELAEQVHPFKFRNGGKARDLASLVCLCDESPKDAVWHLEQGHFESWLRMIGEEKAANAAALAKQAYGNSEDRLEQFVKATGICSTFVAQREAELVLTLAPDVKLELVRVPAGEFSMGSDKKKHTWKQKDIWADYNETPQHKIHLAEFLIGKYPVTVAQFAAFVKATGYQTTAEKEGGSGWQEIMGTNWQHPRGPQGDVQQKANHLVTLVSWYDAVAFCEWASQVTAHTVHLPTEAEWEKAARGTDSRIYPWGNDEPDDTRCTLNVQDTTPVGKYSPRGDSPYGCADMAGNVWEWTSSLFKPYPYQSKDGREDAGSRNARVMRGGAFSHYANVVRCASRDGHYPNARHESFGFRVCVPIRL